ncbi:MAG: hypothetical protein KDB50_04305 [Mycobacterium sp.]|nr:hypothetical protein [Mycobacterium sp.]
MLTPTSRRVTAAATQINDAPDGILGTVSDDAGFKPGQDDNRLNTLLDSESLGTDVCDSII